MSLSSLYADNVIPTYGRFDLDIARGDGGACAGFCGEGVSGFWGGDCGLFAGALSSGNHRSGDEAGFDAGAYFESLSDGAAGAVGAEAGVDHGGREGVFLQ